jgi:shikimate dehydrogenase
MPITNRVPADFEQSINASTRYCAVYGYPVRHSASPAFQNAGIAQLGLNWRYLACEVHPDNLREAVAGARRMKFIGLNLTVPHKLLAYDMVDELDASAKTWGAVNTIRFEARDAQGAWQPLRTFPGEIPEDIRTHGFNTDADAISKSLREDLGVEPQGATILLLGAGGAGKTAALKMACDGAKELYLVNRTESKAVEAAEQIRQRYPATRAIVGYPEGTVDFILNATSLGLKPQDGSPLDTSRFSFSKAGAVYDMIYRPAETPLLRAAKAVGCRTANGLGMLLYQGVKALEIWSGQAAPVAVMRAALERNVYGHV